MLFLAPTSTILLKSYRKSMKFLVEPAQRYHFYTKTVFNTYFLTMWHQSSQIHGHYNLEKKVENMQGKTVSQGM